MWEAHCSAKETGAGVNSGLNCDVQSNVMNFPASQKTLPRMEGLLTKNLKRLSRMISKTITFDFPEIIFDIVRHQIRRFVFLFLNYAPKMEIQNMVTLENVDWFIFHSLCHVHKPGVNEIVLFSGVFLTDEIMLLSKNICVLL